MTPNLLRLYARNRNVPGRSFSVRAGASSDTTEILLYEVIAANDEEAEWWGGVSPAAFARTLASITTPTIHLRINSPGGSVFGGRAIEQSLRAHPGKVIATIDGLAASAATVVLMAANEARSAPGAMLMIHNCWGIVLGNAAALRESANLFDKIDGTLRDTYAARTGQSTEQLAEWMDGETWFTADEARAAGFVDAVLPDDQKPKALTPIPWDLSAYSHAPATPLASLQLTDPAPRANIAAEHRARRLQAALATV